MKIVTDLKTLPPEHRDAVIAIGNFDGVHRGHQALLNAAQTIARQINRPLGVLTFEPHPRRLFRPDDPPERITPPDVKYWRLAESGVDFLCALSFDWPFASQSAAQFIQHVLKDGLSAAHVVVGPDFRFGQLRAGTPDMIREAGLNVDIYDEVTCEAGEKIASSTIRQKLRVGEIESANRLLGWHWEIRGSVFRGDRRGHDLGFPTANLLLKDTLHPAYGVYATRVQIEGESTWLPAATNIGIRPMFEVREGQVEVHILNFPERDIYGKILRVQPVQRLRGEAKFGSLDDLKHQMAKDCAQALEILK
jgi:riboflavin kinase/FMN adenylyltransferase